MARKCVAMPTIDNVQLIASQRQKKREITATLGFVCLYRALKLLTDDQVTSQRLTENILYCFV